ncbi:MAG: PAS domain S-box protein [Deltaproteobacteria bacterium]|nr:PAS domain S-box protein [Deltaproteobacteria bacterium]
MRLRTIILILAILAFLSALTGGFFYYSSLKRLVIEKAKLQYELSVSKYQEHISFLLTEKLREIKALSKTSELRQALKNPDKTVITAANSMLVHFNNSLESDVCYLMDKTGQTVASSNFDDPNSFVGKNYAFRPYFQKAIKGSSAVYLALGITSGKRGTYFSQPIYEEDNQIPSGVIVIKTSADSLEKTLQTLGYNKATALIISPQGIIFMSTVKSWLYQSLFELDSKLIGEITETKQFGKGPWGWTGLTQKSDSQIVDKAGNEYMYHQTKIEELPGWTILSLINFDKISKETLDPIIRLSGYIIAIICVIVGIAVITLYRMARLEIFKRKQAEEKVKSSEETFRSVVESSPMGIHMYDVESNDQLVFMGANPAADRILGVDNSQFIGKTIEEAFPPLIATEVPEKYRLAATEGISWQTEQIGYEDGKIKGAFEVYAFQMTPGKMATLFFDVTERKQSEAAVKMERDFAAAILYWIESIVVVIDLDGYIQKFNQAAEKCSGYKLDEVQQKPFWEILVPPEERNSVKDAIMSADTTSFVSENENYWLTKDGRKRQIHWFNTVLTGADGNVEYLLCTGLDLTERSQAENALQRSEKHYQSVLENMEEGYFETDLAGNFTTVNKSVEETLGYSKSELIGMNNKELMEPEASKKVFEMYSNLYRTGKSQKYLSYEVISKNGEKRALEVSASLRYDTDGHAIGFHGVSRDVTDRIRIEELMVQTEKMMSVGGLAAGMAHELNNPLGGILQGIQNIQRRFSPDLKSNLEPAREFGIDLTNLQSYMEKREIHSSFNGIRESGKKASQIISNMLQFSRKSESKMAPIDLEGLVDRVLDLAGKDYDLKKKFDFRNIKLIKEFEKDLPLISCNETEIEQVVLNVLNNAAWAMANEKRDAPPQIMVRICSEKSLVKIEIEDNGPGMDAETRRRVFEPFFTTKPVGEGTGLGLSVSYMIITNNHKGTMEVQSEKGKGSRFIIRLPLDGELPS